MLGAIVISFVGYFSAPLVVTKLVFSRISTVAEVAGMPLRTMQSEAPVFPSLVTEPPPLTGVNLARAVTPATPAGVAAPLPTSISRAEPVGGVMRLDWVTGVRLPSAGQVTVEVIWKFAPVWAV